MTTWKVRLAWIGLIGLVFGVGVGPASSKRAEATGTADDLVVLVDPSASLAPLTSVLQAASWVVEAQDAQAGLLRLRKNGILAWGVGTISSALEALGLVRAVEGLVGARLHASYQGQQTQPVIWDDELDAASIRGQDAFTLMDLPCAPPSPSSTTPRIAFLDGGFVFTHDAFPAASLADQWDALDHDSNAADSGNGFDDDGDGLTDSATGHGLGMAAAALVVCPHADIYCVRVLDDEGRGDSWSVANGIAWAMAQDVDVINLSFGMAGYSDIVDVMLQDAWNQGKIVVASAGNQGSSQLAFPASLPQVLAISGTEEDGDADAIANYHTDTWMSAPSRNVPGPHPSAHDAYGWWSGTSVSSALAAGTIALALGELGGDPLDVVDEIADEALGFGNVPQARAGKQGAGIFDVGILTEE